jgi:hypothetical protein
MTAKEYVKLAFVAATALLHAAVVVVASDIGVSGHMPVATLMLSLAPNRAIFVVEYVLVFVSLILVNYIISKRLGLTWVTNTVASILVISFIVDALFIALVLSVS